MRYIILSILLFAGLVQAKEVPPPPVHFVYDEGSVLSEQARDNVWKTLSEVNKTDGRQIVVAIFNSLEGEEVQSYSNKVARSWKIGSKKENNGVLLALYMKEHKIRIEVGYGLEPYLTDAKSKSIIQSVIVPNMKRGNIDGAVIDSVDEIIHATTDQPKDAQSVAVTQTEIISATSLSTIFKYVVLIALLVLSVGFVISRIINKLDADRQREENKRIQEQNERLAALRKVAIEKEKARLKLKYPSLSYSDAIRQEEVDARAKRLKEEREFKEREETRIHNKWIKILGSCTLAVALAREEAEIAKRVAEETIRENKRRIEESARRRKREEEEEQERRSRSYSSSYSSSDSSSSSSGSDFGGFSSGGGDFGGGGASGDW